jgi:hypothetical protein
MSVSALDADAASLARACAALWLATLSLMTAFMQTAAPAHRHLLARKIARNLETLREQECFAVESRMTFSKLSQRWHAKAEQLKLDGQRPDGGLGIPSLAWKTQTEGRLV